MGQTQIHTESLFVSIFVAVELLVLVDFVPGPFTSSSLYVLLLFGKDDACADDDGMIASESAAPRRLRMIRLPMMLKLARRTGVNIVERPLRVKGSAARRMRLMIPRPRDVCELGYILKGSRKRNVLSITA